MWIANILFLKPYYLLALCLVFILIIFFYNFRLNKEKFIFFDDLKLIFRRSSWIYFFKNFILILILITFILIFADPNKVNSNEKINKNGIDIVLAFDVSESMTIDDFEPNRLEVAKSVILKFINNLQTDRIGLVVFAGKPFTSVPLTFDYEILKEVIKDVSSKTVGNFDGTAIGDAILSSIDNITFDDKVSDNFGNREKIIILITDGEANIGIDPILASKLAKEKTIKVYTIGIGGSGSYIQYQDFFGTRKVWVNGVDEKTLKNIAILTNGKYFNAKDSNSFNSIFQEISKLEKHEITVETKKEYSEIYSQFASVLVILIGIFFIFNIFFDEKN